MKITEVMNSRKLFQATVRLQASSRSPITTAKTAIYAENALQATPLPTRQFGERSVLSIAICEDGENEDMLETEGTNTLSASELQVKSLSNRAKQLTQQAKQTKARQGLIKAQETLRVANAGSSHVQR
jgi:hypothetical protein